ncbi:VOC family protein [Ohtaekwangia koreensis]|uniref:Glyoxalase/Bleomycin resistance protein/Dioxygenase superfamily protein n=1 Tax=Ohtaekwangia koreensis TaxID=688867 RepID=A0A1T5M0X8_9BACT|nr:VOC family protein [Ohtaekwangia koreensis]SKC81882.1 Glyoxalase/Bleomycin resistance protein/Dioxygenase superfamily protein [Ohtaekwangia koreensis]
MKTSFAPHLTIRVLRPAIDFYQSAFSAVLLRKWDNPDGTIHVAEMEIDGAIFHLHEEVTPKKQLSPEALNATTLLIGLFTPDPDKLFRDAVSAGAHVVNAMEDYDYGYRQGTITDPFGHQWLIQKKI